MKCQCDEKRYVATTLYLFLWHSWWFPSQVWLMFFRDTYKFKLAANKEKGRSKHAKGKSYTSQQLQEAQEDYEAEANLFVFRLKSLKQGQSRSLLTQAARHHAAQVISDNF